MTVFIFPIVLSIIACALLFFFLKNIKQIGHYYSLTASAPITINKFDVQQIKKNQYTLMAEFSYSYKNKEFTAKAPIQTNYPNPWAAAQGSNRCNGKNFVCWFSPDKANEPSLIKKFPLQPILSSCILAGILLYFCVLALYFRRSQKKEG